MPTHKIRPRVRRTVLSNCHLLVVPRRIFLLHSFPLLVTPLWYWSCTNMFQRHLRSPSSPRRRWKRVRAVMAGGLLRPQPPLGLSSAVTVIYKRVLPELPTVNLEFLNEIRLQLLRDLGRRITTLIKNALL